jgi:hypothetical protein
LGDQRPGGLARKAAAEARRDLLGDPLSSVSYSARTPSSACATSAERLGKLVKTYHLENWLAALGQLRAP